MTFQKTDLMGNPYETLSYNVQKNERVMYLQAAAHDSMLRALGPRIAGRGGEWVHPKLPRWRRV